MSGTSEITRPITIRMNDEEFKLLSDVMDLLRTRETQKNDLRALVTQRAAIVGGLRRLHYEMTRPKKAPKM